MDPDDRAKIVSQPSKGPKRGEESRIGNVEAKIMADEVAVERMNALNGNFPKRAGEDAIVGPRTPG